MNLKIIGKLFGLGVALAILVLAAGNQGEFSLAQAGCTVTLKPGESIQNAINNVSPGAVICLAEGTWLENLIITKDNLTLRGQGRNETVVAGEFMIQVSQRFIVENMTLQSSFPPTLPCALPCDSTVQPGQRIQEAIDRAEEGAVICLAKGTWMENITIAKGLTLRGAGQDKTIVKAAEWNYPVIRIESDEIIKVVLEGLTIAEAKNDRGIGVSGKAWVIVRDSTVSGNRIDGLYVGGSANVSLINSTVSGNWDDGLYAYGSANVSLVNSTVSGNREDGLFVGGSAKVTIKGSTIEKNGTDERCANGWICNGIVVAGDDSQTTIIDSIIRNNTHWGVAAYLKKCGYGSDNFTGEVIFRGNNQIYGNGWGDVCLP